MKKKLCLFCVVGIFISCVTKESKITKTTNDSIYVSTYTIGFKDTIKHTYSQPKRYNVVVTNKRTWIINQYIKVGKVGYFAPRHHFVIDYGKYKGINVDSKTYDSIEIGDTILIEEKFYPHHKITIL